MTLIPKGDGTFIDTDELRSGAMPEDWHERNDPGYIPAGRPAWPRTSCPSRPPDGTRTTDGAPGVPSSRTARSRARKAPATTRPSAEGGGLMARPLEHGTLRHFLIRRPVSAAQRRALAGRGDVAFTAEWLMSLAPLSHPSLPSNLAASAVWVLVGDNDMRPGR